MKVVFDIDGTLSDLTHRLHYIRKVPKDWDAFFAACEEDAPIHAGLALLLAMERDGNLIELWTGRPERTRKATQRWLWANADLWAADYVLRMRADGDHRPDDVVKLEYLDACGFVPDIIFEDRASVVEAYRSRGITVYQVARGNF